jgi:hypothetical protein
VGPTYANDYFAPSHVLGLLQPLDCCAAAGCIWLELLAGDGGDGGEVGFCSGRNRVVRRRAHAGGTRLMHWPAGDRVPAPVSLMQVGEAER